MRAYRLLLGFLCGCSSVSVLPGQAVLLSGAEGDIWSAAPPPSVAVDLVLNDQTRINIGQAASPSLTNPTVRLRNPAGLAIGSVGSFEASAPGADGTPFIRGSTVPFLLNGIDGLNLPLFVGRIGAWSRPPDVLRGPHQHPALGIAVHAYLVVAGGDSIAGSDPTLDDVYDVSAWSTLQLQPSFPRSPRSIVTVGTWVLLVDDAGASWLNLYSGAENDAVSPAGLTFAEVAGGDVFAANGNQYLVGATRASGLATDKVLRIDSDLSLHALTLSSARAAAAAAVVGGQIFVAGGSADPASTGAEALLATPNCGTDAECFRSIPSLPTDPTTGAGMVEGLAVPSTPAGTDASDTPDDGGDLESGPDTGTITAGPGMTVAFLAGGASAGQPGGLRRLDLSCATNGAIASSSPQPCAIESVAALPIALGRTHAFALSPTGLLVAGEADDGENHALTIDLTSAAVDEPVLRERRKGASVALFPNGQVGFVGGTSVATSQPVTTLELFIP